ncbi:tetratricopeptide repeat protein [Colwelliaceae bacterium BS250]
MSENIINITPENFQQVILEQSKTTLVLVAFWAEQIPESMELRDKLAKAVTGQGQHIILALVDCQTQQAIAQQFGIQSLPTAVLVKDGQPTDGVTGPQTDETIATFLDKHLPKAEDNLLMQALQLLEEAKAAQALILLQQAYAITSERTDIRLALSDAYLQLGKIVEAEDLLAQVTMIDQDSYYQSLMAKLELAQAASNSPEIQALELQLQSDGDNVELNRNLAVQYSQVSRQEEALQLLYALVLKDNGDNDSKKLLLDILAGLPDGDKLITSYRRKLFSLMY